jgi:hypothetical protein
MIKQKDVLIQLEELSKRIGFMIKQYNDLARSESLDARLVYGNTEKYSGDDLAAPKDIYEFDGDSTNDSWQQSSSCEWQQSSSCY